MTALIPRGAFFDDPARSGVKLSPDGSRISFIAKHHGVANLWLADVASPDDARPLTNDQGTGVRHYFWMPSGEYLVFLQDQAGDENWHLHALHLATGERRDLTPLPKINARLNAVSERRPHELLVGINDRDPGRHDLHLIDVRTGARTLVFQNERFVQLMADADLNVRLGVISNGDGSDDYLRRDGDGWAPWVHVPHEDSLPTTYHGMDELGAVAYFADSRGRDTAAMVGIRIDDANSVRVIASNPRVDAGPPLLHPVTREVQGVPFHEDRHSLMVLDFGIASDIATLEAQHDLHAGAALHIEDRSLDDRRWLVSFIGDTLPQEYWLWDRNEWRATKLFQTRPQLAAAPLQELRHVEVLSRDGMTLHCYITRPANAAGPAPLVLLPHGGPWGRDFFGFEPMHQFLANRGAAALSVNFRGSTGFGKFFVNAGDREWGGKMQDDLTDAVHWAIAEGFADPSRIAVMGTSYGGYAALAAMTMTPELFACGISTVGPSNLVTLLESLPPWWGPRLQFFKDRVGDPTTPEGRAMLTERSPLTHVDRIRAPLLIAQGANDPRVKRAESDQIVAAMKQRGIPVTYLLFPDEGHGFARPENSMAFCAVAEQFLAEHLGTACEPIGEAFAGSSIRFE